MTTLQKHLLGLTPQKVFYLHRILSKSLSSKSTTDLPEANKFLNSYNSLLENNLIRRDEHQIQSVLKLNDFFNKTLTYDITQNRNQPKSQNESFSWGSMFKRQQPKKLELREPSLKGVYLYGGVGCGKTMLMDMFYDHLPSDTLKLRIHFNKFMQDIHKRIHVIKNDKSLPSTAEPFDILAKQLCSEINIIFFDEFQVTDIADAMLMSRLFTALFQNGKKVKNFDTHVSSFIGIIFFLIKAFFCSQHLTEFRQICTRMVCNVICSYPS